MTTVDGRLPCGVTCSGNLEAPGAVPPGPVPAASSPVGMAGLEGLDRVPAVPPNPSTMAAARTSTTARQPPVGMAGLEGLEPPTKGLGNLCSIHLSYSPGHAGCYGEPGDVSTGTGP